MDNFFVQWMEQSFTLLITVTGNPTDVW